MFFVPGESWRKKANCADTPKVSFFPANKRSVKSALALCDACVVKGECLKYALDNEIIYGIWGGTTENQRRKIRSQNRVVA